MLGPAKEIWKSQPKCVKAKIAIAVLFVVVVRGGSRGGDF